MSALMEKDRSKRIGATGFETFTSHIFFADIDFEALERKEIDPVFTPSSEKTNFDATYDLEELLLEEAPLEARARRQKPRAELRDDATAKEIREDELHRIIETMFEPFDYTQVNYNGYDWDQDTNHTEETNASLSSNAAAALAASCNPEDQLPSTGTNTGSGSVHSRQISQSNSNSVSGTSPPQHGDRSFVANQTTNSVAATSAPDEERLSTSSRTNRLPVTSVPPVPQPPTSFSRPLPPLPPILRQKGATRKMSKGGGVQMVLEESGSWSELADQSATLPAEGYEGLLNKGQKPPNSGMLAFLSRKKGRERSPKPTEPGVLGKEGARHIISG